MIMRAARRAGRCGPFSPGSAVRGRDSMVMRFSVSWRGIALVNSAGVGLMAGR